MKKGRKGERIIVKCEDCEEIEFETITEFCLAIKKRKSRVTAWKKKGYLPPELIQFGIESITFCDYTLTYFPKKYTDNKVKLKKLNN